MQRQDSGDQILRVLSSPAETKSFPFAPKRMALMESLWKGPSPDTDTDTERESSTKEAAQPAL